ncbi:nitrilase-related carbon-nitrogen hydrolase [Nocardioides sp. W7]|uniref:nitrilase-related carbon-nitrogen hydrolase n=1 Tax=Nocardioides sp. W7 TaxID=2931390 RepID=UPI001FD00DC7|nr:nitrilase-related carbon-nitrogen hydrolase [Nocardioides sp. W7]
MSQVTIATCQFTSGNDTGANLRRMVGLVDDAADAGADLVVFQEFCNHPALYASPDHVWQSALSEDDEFLRVLKAKAAERSIHLSFNATVRSDWPLVIDQNFLLSDEGEVILTSHKQVLMGSERDHFVPGTREAGVVDTRFGRVGIMSCMEGLIPENPRVLAVKGAQLILNSLSSNGLDEAHTHIPVRAAENGVFVVSANRAGPLVDPVDLDALTAKNGIDKSKLVGGGESQVVDPRGVSLVRAKAHVDDMAMTTVDLSLAGGDGLLTQRRPDLYGALVAPVESHEETLAGRTDAGPVTLAVGGPGRGVVGEAALEAVVTWLEGLAVDLAVLPELFAWDVTSLRGGAAVDPGFVEKVLVTLGEVAARRGLHVVAGVPGASGAGTSNATVLVTPTGARTWYHQVHVHPDDRGWAAAGTEFVTADLPFGRIGLLTGHDLVFPEAARILTLAGADLLVLPGGWRHGWEHRLVAPERSAENHVAVVVAARADSVEPTGHAVLSTPTTYQFPITGEVNMPERHAAELGTPLVAEIDLRASRDKLLMRRTDLLADRQPALYAALADPLPVR